jgi:hydroxymethylpyrimidine pyrophosphatase-like HAD family hydrolase
VKHDPHAKRRQEQLFNQAEAPSGTHRKKGDYGDCNFRGKEGMTAATATAPATAYRALASDFDGTIAHNGTVEKETLDALMRLKQAGYKLILVTGRILHELASIFPELGWFDLVVVENGAVIFDPQGQKMHVLAEQPPASFVARLHEIGMPLQTGEVIVATWEPHEKEVLQTIKDQGLEFQVIFNKGAVMILPSGVNKAFGLRAALKQLGLQESEAVGVGDAENDHAFLEICGLSVAVANALPSIAEKVNLVTQNHHGAGVVELIDHHLLAPPPSTA